MTDQLTRAFHYLSFCASKQALATYTEFGVIVGNGIARGNSPVLERINERCIALDMPLLGVLVVAQGTTLPSPDAYTGTLAHFAGMPQRVHAEQQKCFDHFDEFERRDA